jgi:integrase
MYNAIMADDDMLDTLYLFQPRGPGTAWLFRMPTPAALVGRINPRTGKPYGREIREGLGGILDLRTARRLRDLRLGKVRLEEAEALAASNGSMEQALTIAQALKAMDDDDKREAAEQALTLEAERLERRVGEQKAIRWYKVASGQRSPLKDVIDQYKEDAGKTMSLSSLNNLRTAINEFLAFAGEDVALEEVDRRMVAEFVTKVLPNKKGPKAPDGQGPATIRKKVSQLGQIWVWARKRGYLERHQENPWDEQAPTAKEIEAAADVRRPFTPDEAKKLLEATTAGDALGDVIRVAMLTGVRLEEVASLEASQVDPEARWYTIRQGKTKNAARVVPLVDMAQVVIKARLDKVKDGGPLFGEVPVRKSTGKRGGSLSQAFTRLRRDALGAETDGELAQHCFRHTWRTAANRAGVDLRTAQEMGGWSRGRASDLTYDHGKELEHYREEQAKVAAWLREKGYLG